MSLVEKTVEIKVPSGGYVHGVLTSPKDVGKVIPGSRLILIAHGFAGHKDYCYQKTLSHELATRHGFHTYRFDFRGCGQSSQVADETQGRTITTSDYEDYEAIVKDLVHGKGFVLSGIVGHSRGAVAMFYWAMHSQTTPPDSLPTLVNVSGRYDSPKFLKRVQDIQPERISKGYYTKINFGGEYIEAKIPWPELEDVGTVDLSGINLLPKQIQVLSVYGLKDHIIPLADADLFGQKLKPRHTLRLIQDADHNFYQMTEEGKRINHNGKVVDIVSDWFSPDSERYRFLSRHQYAGVVTRWKDVEGVSNFRDFGGFKGTEGTVRPGFLFRCANPAKITPKGCDTLRKLGITTLFDLRSEQELDRAGVAVIEGVENRWTPVFKRRDLSPEQMAIRAQHFSDPLEGYQKAYRQLLDYAGRCYREILIHIRDKPHDPFIVHCTAGKDRTGVICALILLLMGVDEDTVTREYELTTVGLVHETGRILIAVEKDNPPEMTEESRRSMLGSRYESMRGTLQILRTEYGGVYDYLKNYCNLSDDDLSTIKKNLRADGAIGWRWTL